MAARRSSEEQACVGACTCTGGPYLHGPGERDRVLADRAKRIADEKKEQEEDE